MKHRKASESIELEDRTGRPAMHRRVQPKVSRQQPGLGRLDSRRQHACPPGCCLAAAAASARPAPPPPPPPLPPSPFPLRAAARAPAPPPRPAPRPRPARLRARRGAPARPAAAAAAAARRRRPPAAAAGRMPGCPGPGTRPCRRPSGPCRPCARSARWAAPAARAAPAPQPVLSKTENNKQVLCHRCCRKIGPIGTALGSPVPWKGQVLCRPCLR